MLVPEATRLRIFYGAGMVLPVGCVRECRDPAGTRRETFFELPTRRDRVCPVPGEITTINPA